MTFSIMTLSIKGLINATQHTCHCAKIPLSLYAGCQYAACRILFGFLLSVVRLGVIMLNVVMLSLLAPILPH